MAFQAMNLVSMLIPTGTGHSLCSNVCTLSRGGQLLLKVNEDFTSMKKIFLNDLIATVEMKEIPLQLIFNWDQTGIKLVPSTSCTMAGKGSKRVELIGLSDKRQITAVFCGNLLGEFLPVQLIY